MWTFAPTLSTPDVTFKLPRPVTACRITDRWDTARFEVPLRDGDVTHGRSRRGVAIALRGQLGEQEGQLATGELAMFDLLEQMRETLHTGDPDQALTLTLFSDGSLRRGFRDCSLLKLEYDLSDAALFAYSLLIHASDPVLREGVTLA